ncbi:conserved protein, unknown function [Plasmodium berghei]|uniref:Tyrosine-protein kinase ephrin type A/B receptor-like domain-containing protein n=2 Tax=Plasmodium berghei TaxID=5821 RepID=A0A509AEE3_PLABA|nr:conserved protein, unknown function [Plasmodium berghei ANKA]CXI04609.1 conserved protein, unknown function [Plasmodium berghei]SCL92282.1 conserved protein, unknown function [Plasmodium berghei]SCM15631.1 conserved protein, unknown function [Plasmodium berghei]SCN22724.1 conserved protein, unknown function [Plasmodium berghei]VUC54396.1 conserved protein, unknown function [Plasmodium berghei ANKA]|eukprot:XP_034420228.1 conserved protein, unknown function [Plasmodium berghei ANKA]
MILLTVLIYFLFRQTKIVILKKMKIYFWNKIKMLALIIHLFVNRNKYLDILLTIDYKERTTRILNGKCRAGERLTYDYKCESCKKGFYNFSRENNKCFPCPLGTFNDKLGSVMCVNCPHGYTTHYTGSKSIAECVCDVGFKFDKITNMCLQCNPLEFCDDNERVWSFKNMCMKKKAKEYVKLCEETEKKEIYNLNIFCPKKGVCLNMEKNKSCVDGNKLIQCKICEENYRYDLISPAINSCVYCNWASYLAIFYFMTIMILINSLRVIYINNLEITRIINAFIKYIHYISLLRYINSNYDNGIINVVYLFTVGIPLNEILDCIFTGGTNSERIVQKVNFLLCCPLLFSALTILGTSIVFLIRKNKKDSKNGEKRLMINPCHFIDKKLAKKTSTDIKFSSPFNMNIDNFEMNNINVEMTIDEDEQYDIDNLKKCFILFYILYNNFLYFEIIRLCIFFGFCNYDENRKEYFLIIDDSLKCSEIGYYGKVIIIIVFCTCIKFMNYFFVLFKNNKNTWIVKDILLLYQKIEKFNKVDNILLLFFLILFYKRFLNNSNPSLIYNYKNGLYNGNIHIFQYILIIILFFIYILIMYLYVYEFNDSVCGKYENSCNSEKLNSEKLAVKDKKKQYKIIKCISNNLHSCNNLTIDNVEIDKNEKGSGKNNYIFNAIIPEEDKKEPKNDSKAISNNWNKTDKLNNNNDIGMIKMKIFLSKLIQKVKNPTMNKIESNDKKLDQFLFSFSFFLYGTILLSYYLFLSYIHINKFAGILTIIVIACNVAIYVFLFSKFIIYFKDDIKKKCERALNIIIKQIRRPGLIGIGTSQKNTHIDIFKDVKKSDNSLKEKKTKMEKDSVLNKENKNKKSINNIIKKNLGYNYYKQNFKGINSFVENNHKNIKNKAKRYKLLNISKVWIYFLYNIIDLSNEPEMCLAMLIFLTLQNEFLNMNLDRCLEALENNKFYKISNLKLVLKNFIKYRNKFLKRLSENSNMSIRFNNCEVGTKFDEIKSNNNMNNNIICEDYENLIVFAWGMSILCYCNLKDINYNLSNILLYVSNVLNTCRYFKNIVDIYFGVYYNYEFSHANKNSIEHNVKWNLYPYNNLDFNNSYNYIIPNSNLNVMDKENNNIQIYSKDFQEPFYNDMGKSVYSPNEEMIFTKNNRMLTSVDIRGDVMDYTTKGEYNNKGSFSGLLINENMKNIEHRFVRNQNKQVNKQNEVRKKKWLVDIYNMYILELCRIYIHCLLVDIGELYFNIHYNYTCEKYICNNLLNLWGYNISNNLYMKRYFENIDKFNKNNMMDILLYNNDININIDSNFVLNISDYINKNVINIDFYNIFKKIGKRHRIQIKKLIKEGDYLNYNSLVEFSKIYTDYDEIEKIKNIEVDNKIKNDFFKVFSNAFPIFIEKDNYKYLDMNEISKIEEKKKFIILYKTMGEKYIEEYILKNYEGSKINYFQMDSYGAVISICGSFFKNLLKIEENKFEKMENNTDEDMLKKEMVKRERYLVNNNITENDLLNKIHLKMINKNEYNYTNCEFLENKRIGIFSHNNYECNEGVTGDLKGIDLRNGNSLIGIFPSVILPNAFTIELWLYFNSKKKNNNNLKSFIVCDKNGNSIFVIDRKNDKIESIGVFSNEISFLSENYKRRYYICNENNKCGKKEKKNLVINQKVYNGIYIQSEKLKKWEKINKIVKINKWNLINVTKCATGLVYYINGKYLSNISHEILNLEKSFEICIFGNSCFGNNNVGLFSSFKIFEFLNNEEIKKRYKLIKSVKNKEMIGDNINMEKNNNVIEGIDIKMNYMKGNDEEYFIYFIQSQKNKYKVVPTINNPKYWIKIYQLKFVIIKNECNKMKENRNKENIRMKYHFKIINIDNMNEYGFDFYYKKIGKKLDGVPKIYGINIFSDYLIFGCDLSQFYTIVLYPSLCIYNELVKPCGYTISGWVFFPVEKSISFLSLISGTNDVHICVFSDDMILGSIENYVRSNKNNERCTVYHSSGFSIKDIKKGWYYLSVVGTLNGQFYFINGCFKGYHKFCSFDNIKYIGNTSLFINPFPYICFIKVIGRVLSVNEILHEYSISSGYNNFTYLYYYYYLFILFSNNEENDDESFVSKNILIDRSHTRTDTISSDDTYSFYCYNKEKYIFFYITKNYNVYIYPLEESKNYYFTLSLVSMINKKLYIFNSINDQINNLNIYFINYIVLPEQWTIFTLINIPYINEANYHCLVGGINGRSHIAIDNDDMTLGVLENEEVFKNKNIYEQNEKYNNDIKGDDYGNFTQIRYKEAYQKFYSCGYKFENPLNKNILLTTRCINNQQTFFINNTNVGTCRSCRSAITCFGNCLSTNNEYSAPFGNYKFIKIVFEYINDDKIKEFYTNYSL